MIDLLLIGLSVAVVFGLMVSLARKVRAGAQKDQTARVLADLERALREFEEARGSLPLVEPDLTRGSETITLESALANNRAILDQLDDRPNPIPSPLPAIRLPIELAQDAEVNTGVRLDIRELVSRSDGTLRDAWDFPIVYFSGGRADIGSAPAGRPFFVSPGPDGRFETRDDNVYSYEVARPDRDQPAEDPPAGPIGQGNVAESVPQRG
ncbi:MAG: hypothetical protein AAGK78_08455 [Planctomycetota bacterium]